jgi:hypothetical protein
MTLEGVEGLSWVAFMSVYNMMYDTHTVPPNGEYIGYSSFGGGKTFPKGETSCRCTTKLAANGTSLASSYDVAKPFSL